MGSTSQSTRVSREERLPEVREERCVHSQLEQAGCDACVQACPRGAWVMDEDMLGIDPDRCDGCDLCVPACPQGAIQARFTPEVKQSRKGGLAFAQCEHGGVSACKEGLMPCVHALGMGDLLRLQHRGVSYLIIATADCDSCERGGAERLLRTLTKVNRLLKSRGVSPIHYRNLPAEKWLRLFHSAAWSDRERGVSRRDLFRGVLRQSGERLQTVVREERRAFAAPGELLPDASGEAPWPFVPEIDPALCNGCDACARLCPQQALQMQDDGGAYRIEAPRCTGCGVCRDVCDRAAVRIRPLSRWVQKHLSLYARRCRACGVKYHVPARDLDPLCPICRQNNHPARLFQVLVSEPGQGGGGAVPTVLDSRHHFKAKRTEA